MKQLVILSLVCVALALSKSLPRAKRNPLTKDLPIERLVLDQISLIVVMHNTTGLPDFGDGKKIVLPKLTSCITEPQREAIKVCSKDITPNFPPVPQGDQQKPGKDDAGFVPHLISPFDLTRIVECLLDDTASIDKEGSAINEENLRESFIGHSTLTATQKTLASDTLSACLKTDLPISKPNDMAITERMKSVFKAGFCSFKAMIENGCAEHEKSGKLINHQMAHALESDSSDSAESLGDLTSDEIMAHIKRGRNKCTGNATHHTCGSQGNTASNAGASGAAASGATATSGASAAIAAKPSVSAATGSPAPSG